MIFFIVKMYVLKFYLNHRQGTVLFTFDIKHLDLLSFIMGLFFFLFFFYFIFF